MIYLTSIKSMPRCRWQLTRTDESGIEVRISMNALPDRVSEALRAIVRHLGGRLLLQEDAQAPALQFNTKDYKTRQWSTRMKFTHQMGGTDVTTQATVKHMAVLEDTPMDAEQYVMIRLVKALDKAVTDHLEQMAGMRKPKQLELFGTQPANHRRVLIADIKPRTQPPYSH